MQYFFNRITVLAPRLLLSLGLGLGLLGAPALLLVEFDRVQAQTDIPSPVRRGYSQLGSGQVDAAIDTFEQAVRQFPNVVEAKLGLAIAYRRAGRDEDAWNTYQSVLRQDPDNRLALKTVGLLGSFRPEWQQPGIDALTRLLSLQPSDQEARALRAQLYGFQGQFAAAIADYEIVLRGGDLTPEILLGAAQVYTYSGDFSRGIELFNRFRGGGGRLDPNGSIAYARALRGTGNALAAVQVLEPQLTNATDSVSLQLRSELAQAYLDANRPADALALLDLLRGRPEARLPLARALNEIGQSQNIPELLLEAAGLYRAELQSTGDPPSSLLLEAADVLSGIPSEQTYALQLYQTLIQRNPNDRVLALKQVVLQSQLGQIRQTEAQQRILSLVQPLPQNPAERQAIAQALVPLEPFPAILPVYQQLLAANANAPFLNFRIAQLLIERNDFAGALAALAVYQQTPAGAQDLSPQLLYADIERRQNRLEDSANRYIAILNTGTSDEGIQLAAVRGLAGIRLAQGRPQDAIALYDQLLETNPGDLQLQLARTTIAYQEDLITDEDAAAILNLWLVTRPGETVPELYSLAAALPTAPEREALYRTLALTDPTFIPIQARWVETAYQRNRFDGRALLDRLVNDARAANPNQPFSYLLEGQLAQAVGQLDRSSRAFETVLQREPYNDAALTGLGGLRFEQRRYGEAEALYTQLLTYQPNDRVALQSLAELLSALGRKLEALDQFQIVNQRVGNGSSTTALRMRQIQEDFLRQRGFQPAWERF